MFVFAFLFQVSYSKAFCLEGMAGGPVWKMRTSFCWPKIMAFLASLMAMGEAPASRSPFIDAGDKSWPLGARCLLGICCQKVGIKRQPASSVFATDMKWYEMVLVTANKPGSFEGVWRWVGMMPPGVLTSALARLKEEIQASGCPNPDEVKKLSLGTFSVIHWSFVG